MNKNKDILIIGFALFSMFFGAGNLIFPPYIGISSGSSWLISFLGFILADVGIILLSIIAISKAGSLQNVIGRAGKKFGITLEFLMMLCLGPILVIPRTGATTFEMSILPLAKNFNPVLFSLIFFSITLLLTIKPTKVMDIIGKFLTPILLLSLAFLIVKGIVSPIGNLEDINSSDLFITGVTQGYQTMDALGIGGIVALIMTSLVSKGYTDKNENISLAIKSALIACVGLTVVYGGLTFLGATASSLYDTNISQTALLINITHQLLGSTGTIMLAVVVGFACLTTSIGLTSVTGKFFEDFTNKKLKYEHIVIFICVFSAIVSNFGVDKIIQIAIPILSLIYPVTIVLVVMNIFKKIIPNDMTLKGAAYATFLISLLNVIDSLGLSIQFVHQIPLASLGFNWILPAIIGGIVFSFIPTKSKATTTNPSL
ncbi:branched-chain amino acid transport system II carrier protein [Paraclostridium bifermentans]|uniref:Branched-chain amino acid transport system carrier protein n=1 Tax=Paraclostridium bifermentans TaxID=1490 RepID=A0AA44DKD1_PARBF|nr:MULTISPECIES: branched-chain amino acid transport system II carrier protein [Paraclostridium]MBN8046626.1 branched-chain amino acid transport system II carrier protein [Paraclostridium bifermentans]MBZ6004832.1 branched-chain amino acid transport system II carrier protein [Paraclostridium bifermentans]MDU0296105.1 branched-chain amino acid transport system II carrier protein [Paraclostridium sp. MRS3W1]NME09305.1 branched-chain amino acid transport system II carrier protein [Paraclostridium 